MKVAPVIAVPLGFVTVIVTVVEAPAAIEAAPKDFATVGFSMTVSVAFTPLVSIEAGALRMREALLR
ncbi:MAG: hypothetical protein IPJ28_18480 [Betaproteobacteria bacterium]|nr:hypothetical protein [Betaproteobacteria bacterium]